LNEEILMKEKLKQSWFSLLVIAITIVTWLIALPFSPKVKLMKNRIREYRKKKEFLKKL